MSGEQQPAFQIQMTRTAHRKYLEADSSTWFSSPGAFVFLAGADPNHLRTETFFHIGPEMFDTTSIFFSLNLCELGHGGAS